MKLFLAICLTASIVGATIAFAHDFDPKPTKTILIMGIDGQIDSTLRDNLDHYFQNHPQPPDYLLILITSPGGWSNDVELIGNGLKSLEKFGTMVIFIPVNQCTSGCFWLSSYASEVVVESGTQFGFGHDVKNSTIDVNGFGNFNTIPAFYMTLKGITSNNAYDYKVSTVQIEANSELGSA